MLRGCFKFICLCLILKGSKSDGNFTHSLPVILVLIPVRLFSDCFEPFSSARINQGVFTLLLFACKGPFIFYGVGGAGGIW